MPGYREQYPEQDDYDDRYDEQEDLEEEAPRWVRSASVSWLRWLRGGKLIEYEWVEAPILDAAGITLDEFILDLMIMDDDWD